MTTTRKVLMSGVPDYKSVGYRSRRLSITEAENISPCSEGYLDATPLPQTTQLPSNRGGTGYWRLLRTGALLVALWFSVHWVIHQLEPNLSSLSSMPPPTLTTDKRLAVVSGEDVEPPTDQQRRAGEYFEVMQELQNVKRTIGGMQFELSVRDAKDSSDSEISELKATIGALETRLLSLSEEHRKLEAAAAVKPAEPTPTPAPPVSNSIDGNGQTRNVANSRLGAAIWYEKTTPGYHQGERYGRGIIGSVAAAAQKFSSRYEGASIQARQTASFNNPETVLDEVPVRGYRDGYCALVTPPEPLAIGIQLAYPQLIKAIQIEHVTGHDHSPEAKPVAVHVQAYSDVINEDSLVHAMSYPNIQFDNLGIARFTDRLPNVKIARLAFQFDQRQGNMCCVYRVRVFGTF